MDEVQWKYETIDRKYTEKILMLLCAGWDEIYIILKFKCMKLDASRLLA